jgi:hypothetical protein
MSGIFDQIINYSPPLIVSGTVNYKGTWNASTNNPTLNNPPAASTKGDYYVVSTAGTQFSITFGVGDWIISNGTAWEKVDLTDAVSSVFGRTGAVVGVSTDYSAVGITNTAIGATNPSTGAFTTVSASGLTVNDNTTLGSSNSDTVVFNARVASDLNPSTDNTYDLGVTGHEWRNLNIDGTANIDSLVADTADINGGTIDGTAIGATTPSTVAATTGVFNTNTSALPAAPATTVLQVGGADSTNTRVTLDSFAGVSIFSGRRSNGTNASKTALSSGNIITSFNAVGYGSTAYSAGAGGFMGFSAAENWTDTAIGTNATITLVPNGSTTQSVSFNFANTGIFSISGGATPGINSTAIGNVTPSTGAFTTLSANALAVNGNGTSTVGPTTGSTILRLRGGNTATADGCSFFLDNGGTVVAAYGNKSNILGGAYNATSMLYNLNNLEVTAGGTSTVATFSATGVAVTGALSSTGALAIGNTVATAVSVASTHKVTIVIGGVTYYLLATNV